MRRALFPLLAAACVITLILGCGDERAPLDSNSLTLDHDAIAVGGNATVVGAADIIFEDGPTWDDWSFTHPEQVWVDTDGTKFVSFEPSTNVGASPEFEPVTELRVSFDLYLPERFPVFGLPAGATSTIIALMTYDPTAVASLESFNKIAINLHQGEHWRVHSVGADHERGVTWSSRDEFMTPWIFEHGWNDVEWTLRFAPGAGNDAMMLRVGDRFHSWQDVDLVAVDEPFRHVAVGPWEGNRGDEYVAIDNLVVENLAEPTPTPNPPPDPTQESELRGGNRLSGFWDGWLGRHRMGSKYETFDTYGTMGNNTIAATKMDIGTRGYFECEIYYDTEVHPGEGGGQHLIGVFSQSASRAGPYDPSFDHENLAGWLRLDLGVRQGALQGVIYQDSARRKTFVTKSYPFDAWHKWAPLRVEWEQTDGSIVINVNGKRTEHTIELGLNPMGNLLFVGNMDRNTGNRCQKRDPCGTLGKIRYRNFEWGELD